MSAFQSEQARQRRSHGQHPRIVELSTDDEEDDNIFAPRPDTRPAPASTDKPKKARRSKRRARADDDDEYSPYVDILRVLSFLLVASCGLSYLVSSGESFFWGMKHKPEYLTVAYWKTQITGPAYLTLDELAKYDGSDPDGPVYLSINGSIYDVSKGRHMYGPGGSYHYFAGTDASRGFVTGCFAEDRTGDVRGVEDMFLPLDDPEVDSHWTPAELAAKKEGERKHARKRVQDSIQHWADFFRKNPKYPYVGQLVREPGWEGELKPLCKTAQDNRAPRTLPDKP